MAEKGVVDIAIVGAGSAGITAALYAKRKALSTRLFEGEALGGQTAEATWVENYPGIKRIRGAELMEKMRQHIAGFGIEPEEAAEVTGIERKDGLFELDINNGEEKAMARAVVLCTGSKYKTLNVPGEKTLYGKGLSYCATCDGPAFKGKTVAVVGGGNAGANSSLFFAEICKKVYLIEFLEKPGFDKVYEKALGKAKVELMLNTQVTGIEGKEKVEGLKVKDRAGGREKVEGIKVKDRAAGEEKTLAVDGVFVYIGMLPRKSLAKKIGLKLDEKGYVIVNLKQEASVQGVFAAGDVAGGLAQIIVAAGSGAVAATSAFEYLKGLE